MGGEREWKTRSTANIEMKEPARERDGTKVSAIVSLLMSL